jgi:hypothetical protein
MPKDKIIIFQPICSITGSSLKSCIEKFCFEYPPNMEEGMALVFYLLPLQAFNIIIISTMTAIRETIDSIMRPLFLSL